MNADGQLLRHAFLCSAGVCAGPHPASGPQLWQLQLPGAGGVCVRGSRRMAPGACSVHGHCPGCWWAGPL